MNVAKELIKAIIGRLPDYQVYTVVPDEPVYPFVHIADINISELGLNKSPRLYVTFIVVLDYKVDGSVLESYESVAHVKQSLKMHDTDTVLPEMIFMNLVNDAGVFEIDHVNRIYRNVTAWESEVELNKSYYDTVVLDGGIIENLKCVYNVG